MLWCAHCDTDRWARLLARYIFKCEVCDKDINLIDAKKKRRAERKFAKTQRQKALGVYKSKAEIKLEKTQRRSEIVDLDYMLWVKTQRCCVPNCESSGPSDAHHAVHKSQGRNDRTCVPLCHFHHIGEYHGKFGSVEVAQRNWGIDLIEVGGMMFRRYEILQAAKKPKTETQDKEKDHSPQESPFSYRKLVLA